MFVTSQLQNDSQTADSTAIDQLIVAVQPETAEGSQPSALFSRAAGRKCGSRAR